MSKSTPLGAVAKFAAAGKTVPKKDLALQAIAYGNVYVAKVAMGADPQQTLQAFREAEAYDGPSLVIAYSQCIAHGIDMRLGMDQQYRAVASGHWPLLRYDPVLRCRREEPVPARFAPTANPTRRLRLPGTALPLAGQLRSGRSRAAARSGRTGDRTALECLRGDGFPRSRTLPPRRPQGALMDLSTRYLGLDVAQPAGRVGVPAVEDRRRCPAPRRRRSRCGGAVFAVRRATAPRSRAERAAGRRRLRELRRVAVVLSRRRPTRTTAHAGT